MRIDDDELRDLFRIESEEHLQCLEQGLFRLESNPRDKETLEEVYRAAHSLKGAAAMIGVTKVKAVVHRFEDVLGTARRGTSVLSSHEIERFYQALDGVRQFCEEAITGQPVSIEVGDVLNQLEQTNDDLASHAGRAPQTDKSADSPGGSKTDLIDTSHISDLQQAAKLPASHDSKLSEPVGEVAAELSTKGLPPTIIISDVELRDLFKIETSEHIERLEQGLLRLEKNPEDAETLDEVFRAAHSLKGAARMVSVSKVEVVAHHFEETLGMARRGKRVLTTSTVDRLYQAVDSIREYCDEATIGRKVVTDPEVVLRRLSGEEQNQTLQESPLPAEPPTNEIAIANAPQEVVDFDPAARSFASAPTRELAVGDLPNAPPKRQLTTQKSPPDYSIDTIRVESSKLDALMSHAGELAVTRGRIAHRVVQVEQLLSLWEEWNSTSHTIRSLTQNTGLNAAQSGLGSLREYVQNDRQRLEQLGRLLKQIETAVQGDDARIDLLSSQLEDGIRSIRMLPLSTVFNLFPRLVRDLARTQNKEVDFQIEGGETAADKRILEEIKDPLTHMIRNSVDHGIELPDQRESNGKSRKAKLLLSAYQQGANVVIEIKDNGAGVDLDAIRQAAVKRRVATEEQLSELSDTQIRNLIFAPGFSTKSIVTDVSGRGIGMDVVRANVERLRGTIEVDSVLGQGTIFRLVLPLTVATRRVLIVEVKNYKFAIPVECVQTTRLVTRDEVFSIQGRGTMMHGGEPISVVLLSDLLELPIQTANKATSENGIEGTSRYLECIIIRVENERFGFLVDELLDEQEVVLKSHGPILRRVRNVSGSTILETGEVCVMLNPHDLIRSAQVNVGLGKIEVMLPPETRKRVILLAEDSLVTRTQEKRILEGAGFEVVTAVDGQEAFDKLSTREFDAVVSDVEMPKLNGLDLTAKIRAQPQYKNLPVILVTSLATDNDRKRGMDVGADAYLTKPGFDQSVFVETVQRFA